MDISQGGGAKGVGLLLFIVSVVIWLITITAVFQIKLNETSGNIRITYIPFIDYTNKHFINSIILIHIYL